MNAHPLAIRPAAETPASAAISIGIVRGSAGFDSLRDAWDGLFHTSAAPHQLFQSHAFLRTWQASHPDAGETIIVTATSGDRLVAVLPLVERRKFGVRRLRPMGLPVAQFSDMLVDAEAQPDAIEPLWNAVAALGADLLELPRLRADSPLWPLREGAMVTQVATSPFACLARRVEEDGPGQQVYSPRDRSNLRRRVRRLEELGRVEWKTATHGDEAVELARQAIAMKRRSLKAARVFATALTAPSFEGFFLRAAADPACGLLVSAIELDGRPIAIDLSFLNKGVGFGHVMAMEPHARKQGVGTLLVHHAFASAKRQGAGMFDLLSPADAFKMQHADGVTQTESRVYPFTRRGRLFARALHGVALPAARALLR